ncbi:hypothetical protein AK830_g2343 [Neonectria ditissima]|uniref:Xylanolytic transcriptional activator regulatory domain-containing protein n=1 Tax=Neonectria ditissima TaxID=78410 RepID=A0A0P7BUB5_9HYPO|nr:hypothetical protein AK830_g2343 [Neonectria ditissima]
MSITPDLPTGDHSRYHDLCDLLIDEWPHQRDLDAMLNLPANVPELLASATLELYPGSADRDAPSSSDILQRPASGSHPVLVAKKSLLLGLYLQDARRFSSPGTSGLTVNFRDTVMFRMIEISHNLVTGNDDLVGCLEGIECLMMESKYHNSAGNLRHAWLATRRAMAMAQTMNLHCGDEPTSLLKTVQSNILGRVNQTHVWFRLVSMDRYLSLMVGLPLGYIENSFAEQKALENCSPLERMQRLRCVAAGRILHRDQAGNHDLASAHEIDTLLHEASSLMPPRWWLPPSPGDKTESQETAHIMDVLIHHYLLVRLHLRYLLRFSVDRKYDYSKITAVNASREIVSWFLSFRTFSLTTAYCRGCDFIVFIASITLCIAHLEAHRQRQISNSRPGDSKSNNILSFLVHQRLSDRGMMERTLLMMQSMAREGTDKISSRIAGNLQCLLEVEADAAAGGTYNTNSAARNSLGGEEGVECGGIISDRGDVLRIYIPYSGTVKIERGDISEKASTLTQVSQPTSVVFPRDPFTSSNSDENQTSIHPTLITARTQFHSQSVNRDLQAPPSELLSVMSDVAQVDARNESAVTSQDAEIEQPSLPALDVDDTDWALRDLDLSFFNDLF